MQEVVVRTTVRLRQMDKYKLNVLKMSCFKNQWKTVIPTRILKINFLVKDISLIDQ